MASDTRQRHDTPADVAHSCIKKGGWQFVAGSTASRVASRCPSELVSFEHESNCILTNPVSRAIHDEPEVRGVPAPKGRVRLVAEERLGSWWQHGERNGFSNQSELSHLSTRVPASRESRFRFFCRRFVTGKSNNDCTCRT